MPVILGGLILGALIVFLLNRGKSKRFAALFTTATALLLMLGVSGGLYRWQKGTDLNQFLLTKEELCLQTNQFVDISDVELVKDTIELKVLPLIELERAITEKMFSLNLRIEGLLESRDNMAEWGRIQLEKYYLFLNGDWNSAELLKRVPEIDERMKAILPDL